MPMSRREKEKMLGSAREGEGPVMGIEMAYVEGHLGGVAFNSPMARVSDKSSTAGSI